MISFVIPVYNGEKYLRACVESVLGQAEKNLEILLINDGSTDGSWKIIEELEKQDHRIRRICQENQGVSAARNRGIAESRGEYIWFLDCDDLLKPGSIRLMTKTAEESSADLIMGNYTYYYQDSNTYREFFQISENREWTGEEKAKLTHFSAICSAKLWRRQTIVENSLQFLPLRIGEDVGFYICFLACAAKIVTLKEQIFEYRIYDGSSLHSYSLKDLDLIEVFEKTGAFLKEKVGTEQMQKEMLYDQLFHYLLILNRLPQHGTCKERKQIMDAYIAAEQKTDFSDVRDRTDIMELKQRFDQMTKRRWLYESDFYAAVYQLARRGKLAVRKCRIFQKRR